MKRIIAFVLAFVMMILSVSAVSAFDEKGLTLSMQVENPVMTVNGTEKTIDENGSAPVIKDGRTLLPIRAVVEEMGGSVSWDGTEKKTEITLDETTAELVVDSAIAKINGEEKTLDVAPTVINGRTMLPIRFIAESFGFDVAWDEASRTVTVTKSGAEGDTLENAAAENDGTAAEDTNAEDTGKTLVVYFSATGTTEKVAGYITDITGAEVFELVPTKPYTDEDLDWTDEGSRVVKEHDDESLRDVELAETDVPDWESYDRVFIGYPIWWGIAAWPVDSFVKANDFSGKTVIPFCTSSSSGLGESGRNLEEMAATGDWQEGKRFSSGTSESDVEEWIAEIG